MALLVTYKDSRKTGTKFNVYEGTGSPEGVQIGSVSDIYVRLDGGASTTMYLKETGTSTNTGWQPVKTGTSGGSGLTGFDEELFTATNLQTDFVPTTFTILSGSVLQVEENGAKKYEGASLDWQRDVDNNKVIFNSGRQTGQTIAIRLWS